MKHYNKNTKPFSPVENAFTIVLVGATNVGKSTLFNRITRSRDAIVCNRPGVTVDRHEKFIHNEFVGDALVIDTGGIGPSLRRDVLGQEIERAALMAMDQAHVICFVVDALREPGPEEFEIAGVLRKKVAARGIPVFVLANKCDSKQFDLGSQFKLGFDETLPVSAEHGTGMDEVWAKFAEVKAALPQVEDPTIVEAAADDDTSYDLDEGHGAEAAPEEEEDFRMIVLGRPNVGKSTLLNAILGEERHVVSEISGTTRDVIQSKMNYGRRQWTLLDTAGLRKPGRIERDVEWVAKEKLKEAALNADVAVLVVDAPLGISDMDSAIAGMALEYGLSLVIALNKWDMVSGEAAHDILNKLERTMGMKLGGFEYCPVVQISALTGKGLKELLKMIDNLKQLRTQRVTTSKLNKVFEQKIKNHPHPAAIYGKMPKFFYASQIKVSPPEFVIFANVPGEVVHQSYKRYVENTFRKEFEFVGTPIKLHFKNKRENADERERARP